VTNDNGTAIIPAATNTSLMLINTAHITGVNKKLIIGKISDRQPVQVLQQLRHQQMATRILSYLVRHYRRVQDNVFP